MCLREPPGSRVRAERTVVGGAGVTWAVNRVCAVEFVQGDGTASEV